MFSSEISSDVSDTSYPFKFRHCVVCFRRRLVDTEDELSDIQSDSVPSEVRDWLASTFTRQMGLMLRRSEEKPRFRSIVHAVQAGIFVERCVGKFLQG